MSEPFIANVSEAPALAHPQAGITVSFEDRARALPGLRNQHPHAPARLADGPSWILMVGARRPDAMIHYRRNEAAAAHGASAEESTDDSREAYGAWSGEFTETTMPWPPTR
jgi:hypothetical protein